MTADKMWGSVSISAGLAAKGSSAWSHYHDVRTNLAWNQFTFGDLKELSWSTANVKVNRGTYSSTKVCINPAGGAFAGAASFAPADQTFVSIPASWAAALGDTDTCGYFGTASTTQASHFDV